MVYTAIRALFTLALRLFFRVEPASGATRALQLPGPVIFIGNHPNGLIDPTVLFMLVQRPVTFLAKEPLFRLPVIGTLLRLVGALPVYRKQDGPGDTSKNDGTLSASVDALVQHRAITLFPEGKSHSEPKLATLKTGAARIALEAARRGAPVHVVPVGMTYAAKHLFRSRVHVEVGEPLAVSTFLLSQDAFTPEDVRRLTDAMADSLQALTLHVERWDDFPLVQTASEVYALLDSGAPADAMRLKAMARGAHRLKDEAPVRYDKLTLELSALHRRLGLLRASPGMVAQGYRPAAVARFVARNLLWMLAAPVAVAGWLAFVIPYQLPRLAVLAMRPEHDVESTVKFLAAMVFAPLWWMLMTALAFWKGSVAIGLLTFLAVPFWARLTYSFWEGRIEALRDARTFFRLLNQKQTRVVLQEDARRLALELEALAREFQ